MSTADHGIQQADGNEDSSSNLSGDTLLLSCDDTVNTYADILRRHEKSPNRSVGASQDTSFLGRGRVVTDFERQHFGLNNITPGRPCTGFFSAAYFVDSKAVFDKLEEVDIPKELVVCLQWRPSGEVLITFIDEDTKSLFVRYVAVCSRDSVSVINDEDMRYDTPHELPVFV